MSNTELGTFPPKTGCVPQMAYTTKSQFSREKDDADQPWILRVFRGPHVFRPQINFAQEARSTSWNTWARCAMAARASSARIQSIPRAQDDWKLERTHEGFRGHGGTPKWMVYKGKSQSKMDDLGVPTFQETSIYGKAWKSRNLCSKPPTSFNRTMMVL